MGSSIADARETAKKGQVASEKTFNDTIKCLQQLAEEKMLTFEKEVYGNNAAQKLIPI